MKAIIFLLTTAACLEGNTNHDSDLSNTSHGQIYVKTVLSDFGVRKNNRLRDNRYGTILHYLAYKPRHIAKAVQLSSEIFDDTGGVLIFTNMLLSYQRDNHTYTCRLENVPFASEHAITESAACFADRDDTHQAGKDAYLFASMCVEHGKINFHRANNKDFSCDLSSSCSTDTCPSIHVNVGCIADGSSFGGACTAVKALWDKHKNEQSKSVAFVEQLRTNYTSCQYADSSLDCVSANGDDGAQKQGDNNEQQAN